MSTLDLRKYFNTFFFVQFKVITETVVEPPNFSVETFFYFLFVMMVVSFVAFSIMDLLPAIKKLHVEANPEKKLTDLDEEMKMIEKSKGSF